MAKTMTPLEQGITDGQIHKAAEAYQAMLVKHRHELPSSDAVQKTLGSDAYLGEQLGVLRKHVERASRMVVRRVTVDRSRTPEELVEATGRRQFVDRDVLASMPRRATEGVEEVEFFFFNEGRFLSPDEQERVLAEYGLEPDYEAQFQVNIDDPAFADTHPNGMQWRDGKNRPCYADFLRVWDGERGVDVYRSDDDWHAYWWFAGRRK